MAYALCLPSFKGANKEDWCLHNDRYKSQNELLDTNNAERQMDALSLNTGNKDKGVQ